MHKIPLNKLFGGKFLCPVAPLIQLVFEQDSKKRARNLQSNAKKQE